MGRGLELTEINCASSAPMMRHIRHFGSAGVAVALGLGLGVGAVSADVVAVVSSKSPITTLNKSQVTDIFMGKRTRFPDGSSAVPIDQSEGSAARDAFYARIADMSPAQVKAFWSKAIFTGRGQPPRTVATSLEAKKALVANPNAIGYIDQSLVDSSVRVVLTP
jgi:ABC-type phosphate transport system substrate-binding protein